MKQALCSVFALVSLISGEASRAQPLSDKRRQGIAVDGQTRKDPVERAASGQFAGAFQAFPYADASIYRVMTAPERVTDIVLQAGETLVAVASGDTARWIVGDTSSGSGPDKRTHILIKPASAGLTTNLLVTTDRRSYHLLLTSARETGLAGISWTYPQDALIALREAEEAKRLAEPVASGLNVEKLDFRYVISGDSPTWRPVRTFDDGRQTYIEFPSYIGVGEAPPLFVLSQDGEAQLVNYRMRERYYVVDRLFDRAELRLGTKRQQIVRISKASSDLARARP
ncbi:P-type conjugative transfer protein TrbG [Sphingobium yanoikuyae]|uniref:P-type conjugative transfer protein TrbG n=1 Tax=Sphingobium yanoikuyae TaxID=13690 RepID=A0A084ET21_SPHYA|nr:MULTISPECIES: P-type conjugative transfer protein TrbG [Sphingobium]KEZ21113.1 P-type conjugative transfer protein TrbG [Sphingobium yanoikuyae]PZU63757.1 MAG: P-type conjugative transfer protein TrbG [Sphingobium sp.]